MNNEQLDANSKKSNDEYFRLLGFLQVSKNIFVDIT